MQYYGTIDATPLFLILVAQHAAWTGDLTVFHDLRDHIERALEWIATYGDPNGDGYLEYQGSAQQGLINQGWKDSGDAVVNGDGTRAQPPIALVEVQGYVYLAMTSLADLYAHAGEADRAAQLRREAQELRGPIQPRFLVSREALLCSGIASRAPTGCRHCFQPRPSPLDWHCRSRQGATDGGQAHGRRHVQRLGRTYPFHTRTVL
jgi:hypothetical protein